jgi:hypothetical protein
MSSAKANGGRTSAQNVGSSGVRKVHSRHTWVKSLPFFKLNYPN